MPDITFWAQVRDNANAEAIVSKLERICTIFGYRDEYEIIVISYVDSCSVVENFEQKYSENVMLVRCDESQAESALDVMLGYANGLTFLEVTGDMEFSGNMFDKLLYDANICDENTFRYIRDKYTYIVLAGDDEGFPYHREFEHKCIADRSDNAGTVDGHYFFQDIYVASRVRKAGIKHIYDIGSRVDGYISHLLSMGIDVTMIDIRPLGYEIEGLSFIQGNASELSGIEASSIDYLSCLHALEHFGLGRYGDPLDYTGWKKALAQYKRVLKIGGILFLSVPIGNVQRVCFNAHRVFEPLTIIDELNPEMKLLEFTYIHDTKRTTIGFENNEAYDKMHDVVESITKTRLGGYDCGIFIFERY